MEFFAHMKLDSRQHGLMIEYCFRGLVVAEDGSISTTKMPKDIQAFAKTELNLTVAQFANSKGESKVPVFTHDNAKNVKKDFHVIARRVGLWDRPVDWNDLARLQEYGIHNLSVLRDIPSKLSLIGINLFIPTYRQLKWWQVITSYFPDMEYLDVVWFASIYHYRELHADIKNETPDFKDIDLMISLQPWESVERLNKYLEIVLKEENPSVFTMLEGMQGDTDREFSIHYKTIETFITQASHLYQSTPWRLPSLTPREFLLWQESIKRLRKIGLFENEPFTRFAPQRVSNALSKQGRGRGKAMLDGDREEIKQGQSILIGAVDETAVKEELKKLYLEKGNKYEEEFMNNRSTEHKIFSFQQRKTEGKQDD